MLYSVMPPPSHSPNWNILNERSDVVFSGHKQQCEEWLDIADFRAAAGGWPPGDATDDATHRLPIFELADALLRRFWMDCSGALRLSDELPAIFLMTAAILCIAGQFLFTAVVQQASLIGGAWAVTRGHSEWGTGLGTHGEASCAGLPPCDIACDAMDDFR